MSLWLTLAVNSIAMGGLLFLLSGRLLADFRADAHPQSDARRVLHAGRLFRLHVCSGRASSSGSRLVAGPAMALLGGFVERGLLRRLAGQHLPQVLLTLGFSFMVGDICLMLWTGDPWQPATPDHLRGVVQVAGLVFPIYRLVDRASSPW